jgi:hypothetical protein
MPDTKAADRRIGFGRTGWLAATMAIGRHSTALEMRWTLMHVFSSGGARGVNYAGRVRQTYIDDRSGFDPEFAGAGVGPQPSDYTL